LAKKKKDKPLDPLERKPWIDKSSGIKLITIISSSLALWVGYQIIRTENNWGRAILWGAIFAASTWLVYFGMNAFHSLFSKDKKDRED